MAASRVEAGNKGIANMARKQKRKPFSKRVFVGFCDGRPDYRMIDTGFGGWGNGGYRTIIVFTDKKRAQREYEEVRVFELRERR